MYVTRNVSAAVRSCLCLLPKPRLPVNSFPTCAEPQASMYTAHLLRSGKNLMVSYPLLALTLGPYLNNAHGTGNKAREMKPSRLVAHAMPSRLYTNVFPRQYRSP